MFNSGGWGNNSTPKECSPSKDAQKKAKLIQEIFQADQIKTQVSIEEKKIIITVLDKTKTTITIE